MGMSVGDGIENRGDGVDDEVVVEEAISRDARELEAHRELARSGGPVQKDEVHFGPSPTRRSKTPVTGTAERRSLALEIVRQTTATERQFRLMGGSSRKQYHRMARPLP